MEGCQDSLRDRAVWFKFITETNPKLYRLKIDDIPNSSVQVFKGENCDTLNLVFCKKGFTEYTYYTNFLNLEPNREYKIKLFRPFLPGNNPGIAVQSIPFSRKISSKVTGGFWHLASTWQEGRIPIDGDSVYITPGSRVLVNGQYFSVRPSYMAYLQVGSNTAGSLPASISAQGASFFANVRGNIEVGTGDSLIALASQAGAIGLQTEKDLVLNGVLAAGNFQSDLYFTGQGKQRFYGSGKILAKINQLTINKPGDTVHCQFPVWANKLYLTKGVYNAISPFYLASNRPQNGGTDSVKGSIFRVFGRMTRKPVLGSYLLNSVLQSFPFLAYFKPESGPNAEPDSSIHVGQEFIMDNPNQPLDFVIAKKSGNSLIANRNLHGLVNPILNVGSTLVMRQQDTLHLHLHPNESAIDDTIPNYWAATEDSLSGVTDGTIYFDSAFVIYNSSLAWSTAQAIFTKNGKQRAVFFQGRWPSSNRKAKGFRMYFNHIVQAPGGNVVAPLTQVGGRSIMRISANQPLPANNRIAFWVFARDQILGNQRDIRIAQAPGPNGPWKMVSGAPPALNSMPYGIYSNYGVDLSNGEYFCVGTVANVRDAAALNIVPAPSWQMGCGQALKTGVVIQNLGVNPITEVTIQATHQNTGQNVLGSYAFNPPLAPLAADTAWIENGLQLDNFGVVNLRGKVLLAGDGNASNDTVSKSYDLGLKSLPYTEYFSNPQPYYKGDSTMANIYMEPGWWINTEYVFGSSYQSWDTWSRYLTTIRESMLGIPLLAHSPAIAMPAGNYQLRYSYRWKKLVSDPVRPAVLDTLRLSLGSQCGQSYRKLDEINRDVHPNPPLGTWLRRTVQFTKEDNDPAYIQIQLKMPFGMPNLEVSLDSIQVIPVNSVPEVHGSMSELTVYPNPSSSGFRVVVPEPGGRLRMVDALGREAKIDGEDKGGKVLSVRSRPDIRPGIYHLLWRKGSKQAHGRIILE